MCVRAKALLLRNSKLVVEWLICCLCCSDFSIGFNFQCVPSPLLFAQLLRKSGIKVFFNQNGLNVSPHCVFAFIYIYSFLWRFFFLFSSSSPSSTHHSFAQILIIIICNCATVSVYISVQMRSNLSMFTFCSVQVWYILYLFIWHGMV